MHKSLLFVLAMFFGLSVAGQAANFVNIRITQPKTVHNDGSSHDDDSSSSDYHPEPTYTLNSFSGWPLTITMTMRRELGIASTQGNPGEPPFYSGKGKAAFVVFKDPDDCLAMDIGNWPAPSGPGCPGSSEPEPASDETYFAFVPDVDDLGLPSPIVGFPGPIDNLVEASSGRQEIVADIGGGVIESQPVGARSSAFVPAGEDEIKDGYGYGADDDVPGLVIVSAHGPGIAYQPDGIAKSPKELINLAGFINSVSYELSNPRNRIVVTAQMVVPPFLIAPVVVVDESYGVPNTEVSTYWRIDGSPTEVPATPPGESDDGAFRMYPNLVDDQPYTISVMAVSGIAPNSVVDMTGDGEINEHDLEQMGYTVIGRKKSVTVELFPGIPCHGGSGENTAYADLDGNGVSSFSIVCPAGAGSISKPPR